MAQQCFNFLIKQGKAVIQGKPRPKSDDAFVYLDEMNDLLKKKSSCTTSQDFLDINTVHEALKVNLAKKVFRIVNRFIESKASKKDFINSLYA